MSEHKTVGFTMSAAVVSFVQAKCADDPRVSEVIDNAATRSAKRTWIFYSVPREVAELIERELRAEVLARQLSATKKRDLAEAELLAAAADRIRSKLDGYT